MIVNFVTPCPGTYNIDYKRKYIYHDSFGGKKLPIPATKTLCIPNAIIVCDKCGLRVKGDFWQKMSPLSTYCRSCMTNEKDKAKYSIKRKNVKFKRLAELDSFDVRFKRRSCGNCLIQNNLLEPDL
ncbi:hypothetical protein Bhyg_00607 [Pseudolycoriella hygida]|uniref:Uncharacterized protein n=1 Tax=Pseudolycoriella hygida TaxID=35572 RepID=A0A9Q0N7U3_9DIPT|nr:hypothetical protein Bhyg_00607 [Pseudolycoriella hygida]